MELNLHIPMDEGCSTMLLNTKYDIMKKGTDNHYNNTGQYYYFGNKGLLKIIGSQYVGQYAMK